MQISISQCHPIIMIALWEVFYLFIFSIYLFFFLTLGYIKIECDLVGPQNIYSCRTKWSNSNENYSAEVSVL